jgi:hypothetical protein
VTDTNHEALFTGGDVEAGNCKDRRGKFRRSWRGIKGTEMAGFGFSGSNSNVQSDESRDQWLTDINIDNYWAEMRLELIRYGFMNEHFLPIEDREHPTHNEQYGNGYSDGEWNKEMLERVVLGDETPNVIKAGNDGKTKMVHDHDIILVYNYDHP